MSTYACVYVPEFPAQALLRLRPQLNGQPVGVLAGEPPFESICSRNKQAARLGLCLGIPRTEAEVLGIPLLRRLPLEEESTRGALLACLGAFTPAIEQVPGEGACTFVLDLSGTEKLLGPLATAIQTISACIARLKITARIATGSNFHTLVTMAPVQGCPIVHTAPGEEQQALVSLPLSALPLSDKHAGLFLNWGIKTLGDLARLPEVELITRMGQEGKRLRALARGEHPHYFNPITDPIRFEEYLEFDSPVEGLESLLFALNMMLEQLLARVRTYACALASVTVQSGLEGAPPHSRTVRPALPTEDRRVLLKLLQLDLEAHAPAAGVVTLRLIGETGPVSKVQIGLFSPELPEPMRLEVTLARLSAIVGEDRSGKAVLADTHVSDAFTIKKFTAAPPIAAKRELQPERHMTQALRRFRPPQPVRVEHGLRAACILWHDGARYQVQQLYGPWRTSGCWWSEQVWASTRWDFAAQAEDGSLLTGVLLQDATCKTWLLEGIYD